MQSNLYGKTNLKPREQEIVRLVTEGLKNAEIARVMGTTEPMVKNHMREIYDKLGMWNRVELALWHISRDEDLASERKVA